MNKRILTLTPLPREETPDYYRRRCRCLLREGDRIEWSSELFFDIPKSVRIPEDGDCDGYLRAMLMEAMYFADSIRVEGTLTDGLLANLSEFQDAWTCWLPDELKRVEIEAEKETVPSARKEGAVVAFSGGLDAAFSFWRHRQRLCGHASREIRFSVFIHGFDIPLSESPYFELAQASCRSVSEDQGVPLLTLRTNYREISRIPWKYSHTPAFVATFSQLKHEVGTLLFGSSEPYNSMILPWGSNPITDRLLGSGDFEVIHDGAAFSRTQKTRAVAQWQAAVDNLRVCWQETGNRLNCCRCEKCLRTTMNYLAERRPIPKSLESPTPLIERINQVKLRGEVPLSEWNTMLKIAKQNQIHDAWVKAAERQLRRRYRKHRIKALKRSLKQRLFNRYG